MHPTINKILESARKRTPRSIKRRRVISRNFHEIVEIKKQRSLIPMIAEIKPSSPTKFIRNVTPSEAAEIASQMEAAGAAAISVLTEPQFFNKTTPNTTAAGYYLSRADVHELFYLSARYHSSNYGASTAFGPPGNANGSSGFISRGHWTCEGCHTEIAVNGTIVEAPVFNHSDAAPEKKRNYLRLFRPSQGSPTFFPQAPAQTPEA